MPEDLTPLIAEFEEFFSTRHRKEVEELAEAYPSKRSLLVPYSKLEKFSAELADELVEKPDRVIEAAKEAVKEMQLPISPEVKFEPHVRFFGMPEHMSVLIQGIGAAHIGRMVSSDGVITKRAEVRPKVQIVLYRCSLCDAVYKVPLTKGVVHPDRCESCKRPSLKVVDEESVFVDLQKAEAQEPLEKLKGGAPASHIELWFEDDLVNTIVPGDRVAITGILRIRPPRRGEGPLYSKYLDVLHVERSQKEFEEIELTKEEETEIKELARAPDVSERIVHSLAPSIYGHDEVKEALALQLFGGTPNKSLPEGGRIRSDIHVLLVGDPGSAKTRFLQYVTELAPKGIYVSGKSVTGAGLTAAAEKDELGEGGWTLKAGALVLASGGIAGVDEFDKINEEERAAMHEIMESQSVSIAKAGIVAKFRAKTSILAAANPKEGRFDPTRYPAEQFDIPPTILSRFDLIFPIKDILDEEKDRKLADHVLLAHTYAASGGAKAVPEELKPSIATELVRKYIAYAKKNVFPVLTKEANEKIKEFYVDLRRKGLMQGAVPITPRYIEGLVRLSEASARMRLSSKVELVDAERAITITDFMLRSIMMDKSTGRLDVDIIATGVPKSKADRIRSMIDLVKSLEEKYEAVEIDVAVDEAVNSQLCDKYTAHALIRELMRRGEFFEPKHGHIKVVKPKVE